MHRTVSTPALISLEAVKTASDPKLFQQSQIPVGVLLEGKFNSLYANRISAAQQDSLAKMYNQPFLKSGEKNARIIVCADGDIVIE